MKLFFIFFFTILTLANVYVAYRFCTLLPHTPVWRTAIILSVIVLVLCLVAAYTLADSLPLGAGVLLYKAGNTWLIALLYLFIIFLVCDILRLTHLVPMEWMTAGSRMGAYAVAGGVALLLLAGNIVYHNKKRVGLDITTEKSLELVGGSLRIVVISDLHLGYGIGPGELRRWVDRINSENADVILIAGDMVDSSTRPLWDRDMASAINGLRSKYGTYAALGNHEYIAGIDKSLKFINHTDVRLLRDEVVEIEGAFYIVGRDDRTNGSRASLEELTGPLDKTKPIILLDHQPYALSEASECGVDVQFSGHTHRGQVWPASLITRAMYENDHGYTYANDTHYYVSSGLGIWGGKFRIGTRSEYVLVNITSGK